MLEVNVQQGANKTKMGANKAKVCANKLFFCTHAGLIENNSGATRYLLFVIR